MAALGFAAGQCGVLATPEELHSLRDKGALNHSCRGLLLPVAAAIDACRRAGVAAALLEAMAGIPELQPYNGTPLPEAQPLLASAAGVLCTCRAYMHVDLQPSNVKVAMICIDFGIIQPVATLQVQPATLTPACALSPRQCAGGSSPVPSNGCAAEGQVHSRQPVLVRLPSVAPGLSIPGQQAMLGIEGQALAA